MMISEEIERLKKMYEEGTLSAEEFARAKQKVLDGSPLGEGARAVNKFRLSRTDVWIGGVCGGLAELTGIESWIWRLLFMASLCIFGSGLFFYILLWMFVPRADY
ncbi:MAG: PspC domain-containing protein [Betaproteobacteria bacterium]|nr:PspC domain-containing protein [Betaproteobacteria bacterium]